MDVERPGRLPVPARDLVARLHEARAKARACRSPARALAIGVIRWPVSGRVACARICEKRLIDEGLHKIEIWTARHGVAIAEWPTEPVDPFFNVNTPEDAARAERIALQHI